jgi:CHAD domain-containing protein
MKRPYVLAPDDRADESLRTVLRHLFGTLRANIEGVLEDSDIEFLHDLRVANRRSRTALSQIKGVLPSSVVDRFSPEFKWLGIVTGRCRDLDVWLLQLDRLRRQAVTADAVLTSMRRVFESRRDKEHEQISTALRSERFHILIDGWSGFLDSTKGSESEAPLASAPIFEVAGPRVFRAAKRIRKRGFGVGVDAPTSLLHRLRIDGKKLRYLLEFFSDLYPPATVSRFIDELKRLQDTLGDFNDTQVQLAFIQEFMDRGAPLESKLGAASRLIDAITEREHELRAEFVDRFAEFTGEESRRLYKKTFMAT